MNKVIVLDYGLFLHRAIFAWGSCQKTFLETRNFEDKPMSVTYTCMNMIMSCLVRIGVDEDDIVIVACDGRYNWRKGITQEVKHDRQEKKDSQDIIDWKRMYGLMDELLFELQEGTDWHTIRFSGYKDDEGNVTWMGFEADDIWAVCARYYKDKEVIGVSYDEDWQQLWIHEYVKIFSPHPKNKTYKIKPKNFNAVKLVAKKILKQVKDGLIAPVLSEQDYDTRQVIASLLELPDFVENTVREKLDSLNYDKKGYIDIISSPKIASRISTLYNTKDKIIEYEKVVKKAEAKENKKKKNKLMKKLTK